jgi:prophage regulatory protein
MTSLPTKTRGLVRRDTLDRAPAGPQSSPHRHGSAVTEEETPSHAHAPKLLRFPAVRERTGLSRSTIWRLERQGAFPKHHRISANAVAWVEEDIANWIRSKVTKIAV